MVGSLFSLGNECLSENTDSYLREKFAKAKPKSKAKVKVRKDPSRTAKTEQGESRSKHCAGPQQEDLDEAERDLLGLSRESDGADEPGFTSQVSDRLEPLDAGPAQRLAVPSALLFSKRSCSEGHQLCCYVIARSAALCDNCDLMQKPGEVVFGCSTCDSELCAKCALSTATTEETDESLELIAKVMHMFSGESATRFVATPTGAVLDTSVQPQLPDEREVARKAEGPTRRRIANEVDDSDWKQQTGGYPMQGVSEVDKHRDVLGELLEEQERPIQARHLDRRGCFNSSYVPATSSPSSRHRTERASAEETNLMDENAAKERPSWAVDGSEPKEIPVVPLERTFDLTLTLTGDFVDELARGYSQPWFQELLKRCCEECADREKFLERLQDVAFEVQRPILENWGFEGNEQGVYDMTSILLEHSRAAPSWLQEKIDRCLFLLYGGQDGIVGWEAAAMAQRRKGSYITIITTRFVLELHISCNSAHILH
ncbi:unnamed protein product [Cladocopium goreaui]|uniref:Deoxyribonuclease TATDN1 n=1 Tax=Cladocopium goreaui TaxID=2562237 RepID=A0A9P1CMD9_9DINO|nr:unnamed protein product [Cladocopium goreaui]